MSKGIMPRSAGMELRERKEREEEDEEKDDKEEDEEEDDEAEGAKKRPHDEISSEDEGPVVEDISGTSVMEEKAPKVGKSKKSARQGGGGAGGSSRGADGSSGGGKKCLGPEVVEDISEASGMEEGELSEDPGGVMVFGSPNDEQRGRGTRRNRREEEKKTSAENAGLIARRKADKEREVEKRRAGSTEGELGK
ncbi:tau-tubulin kinase 1-like [Gymnodraco acuticeps]|uniref:Tau-tubulin kinase 1-like n=1 Tax=Gymnodraco acuticeps TaxID=8218 RepID=A0A6P8VNK6_GYMAC|nr:tau-tubulin kinase 1-like [Gymnodraco acuticeps]